SIRLSQIPFQDTEEYEWVDPTPAAGKRSNCGTCHQEIHREWAESGHSRSAQNRHFLNLYDGSDWSGGHEAGWNLLADHRDGGGVCTACHAPSLSFADPAYF